MTGDTLNYKKCIAIPVGQYTQINEEETPSSSTRPLARGAICMVPSINNQGRIKFMTLGSMKNMVSRSWDAIPMSDTVIAQVDALSQGQPNDLDFLDCKKCPILEHKITGVDAG